MAQQLHAAAAAKLSSELKLKECPAFVGSMSTQPKGLRFLCMTDGPIPLTYGGFGDKKQMSVNFLLINCLQEGFTAVPHEFNSKTNKTEKCKDKNGVPIPQKPLTVRKPFAGDGTGQLYECECMPYKIIEGCPRDKGMPETQDYNFRLLPGLCFFIL